MRLRDALKLEEGDYVVCTMCPEHGCDGKPQRAIIEEELRDGYLSYSHEGNPFPFAYRWYHGPPEWEEDCDPRLIRKATPEEVAEIEGRKHPGEAEINKLCKDALSTLMDVLIERIKELNQQVESLKQEQDSLWERHMKLEKQRNSYRKALEEAGEILVNINSPKYEDPWGDLIDLIQGALEEDTP